MSSSDMCLPPRRQNVRRRKRRCTGAWQASPGDETVLAALSQAGYRDAAGTLAKLHDFA